MVWKPWLNHLLARKYKASDEYPVDEHIRNLGNLEKLYQGTLFMGKWFNKYLGVIL